MILEVPFEEKITGMAITKQLEIKEQITLTMRINSLETWQCLQLQMIHIRL